MLAFWLCRGLNQGEGMYLDYVAAVNGSRSIAQFNHVVTDEIVRSGGVSFDGQVPIYALSTTSCC